MFWCAKSVKFYFRWGTKPRHQKQETGNDCDVNSGLQASRKTDFTVIFLLWANQFAKENGTIVRCLWENKKTSEKSVFREAWSPELTSQSFPVPCFWSDGFVPHRKWNLMRLVHQNTGKENRYGKNFFASLISKLGRFNRANKRKSVMYTLS